MKLFKLMSMRKFKFLAGVILISITMAGITQTIDSNYEVATWNGFREGAVTYTFDDNTPNQFTTAIPMFREFNFTAPPLL